MALVRHERSKYWWVDYWVGSGKNRRRVRKSTGLTDAVQAAIYEKTLLAVRKGLTPVDRAMEIIRNIVPDENGTVPIDGMLAYYQQCVKEDNIRIEGIGRRFNLLAALAVWVKRNTRAKFVADIDAVMARAFANEVFAGDKAHTRNNKTGHLGTAWKAFIVRGKAKENPWTLIKARRNSDEEESGRSFTDEEMKRLMSVAREAGCEWEPFITLAVYTGLRRGDCEQLSWDQVDFGRHVIVSVPSKTRRRNITVMSYMHPKLEKAIRGQVGKDATWVFPFRHAHLSEDETKKDDVNFAELMKRAGIVGGNGVLLSFHCLRHTFATRLAEAGVAQDVRMKLTGHTVASTHERYDHQVKTLMEAVMRLG